ncbi:unnamed protein product [Ascophyllum nodosum]
MKDDSASRSRMYVTSNVVCLVVYMALVVGGCGYLLGRFRMRTGELKIRARSPTLATIPAIYAIIVGGVLIPLQELLQLLGKDYPCQLTLVQSCFFLPVWGAPFALRSLRVIIVSNKGLTEKYGFVLRKRTTLAMEALLCMVAACIVIVVTQTIGPYDHGVGVANRGHGGGACYILMEWEFLLPLCVIQAVIFGVLGELLRDVDDLLNISGEIRVNFALYLLFVLPYFALQLYYRFWTHQNFPTSLQFLMAAMVVSAQINTMWASVGGLEDLLEFIGWKCVPGEGFTMIDTSLSGWSEASTGDGKLPSPMSMVHAEKNDLSSWKRHFNNIPSIMRNKPMSAVLRTIANRFLCTESYDFLVRVSGYRRSSADAGEMELGPQHALFVDICKAHVVINSEQEINISHEQRTSILQYMNSSKFASLGEEERADILFDAQKEVSSMLELNLLNTLHESAAFAEACAALDVEERMLWYLDEEKYGGFFTPAFSNYETPIPRSDDRKNAREPDRVSSDPPLGTGDRDSGGGRGAHSRGGVTGARLRRGLLEQWRLRMAAAAVAAANFARGRPRQPRVCASSSDVP